MKQIQSLIILIMSAFLVACGQISSEDVNPDVIQTNYQATYNETGHDLEVKASFTIGGNNSTYVDLKDPSHVVINARKAVKETNLANQIFYVDYSVHNDSNKIGNIEIIYTDPEERTYANTLIIPSKVIFSMPSSVVEGDALTIDYQVESIFDSATEMRLYFTHQGGGFTQQLSVSASSGSHTMLYDEMNFMHGKDVQVKLCRTRKSKVVNHPGEGGSLNSSYCSVSKTVSIKGTPSTTTVATSK